MRQEDGQTNGSEREGLSRSARRAVGVAVLLLFVASVVLVVRGELDAVGEPEIESLDDGERAAIEERLAGTWRGIVPVGDDRVPTELRFEDDELVVTVDGAASRAPGYEILGHDGSGVVIVVGDGEEERRATFEWLAEEVLTVDWLPGVRFRRVAAPGQRGNDRGDADPDHAERVE